MKFINLSKYVAYLFLGLIAILALLLMLVLSPLGVSTLVNIANKQEGIVIENVSGSFYSAVSVGKLSFTNPQIDINGEQLRMDIGLNCLFAGEACINSVSARKLDLTLKESEEVPEPSEPLTDYIELPILANLEKFALERVIIYQQAAADKKQKVAEFTKIAASLSMQKVLNVRNLSIADAKVFASASEQETEKTLPSTMPSEHWIKLLKAYEFSPIDIPSVFVPINVNLEKLAVDKFCIEQAKPFCTLQSSLRAMVKNQSVNMTFVTKPVQQIAANIEINLNVDLANAFSHKLTVSVLPNTALSSLDAQALVMKANGEIGNTQLVLSSGTQMNEIAKLLLSAGIGKQKLPLTIELSANNFAPVVSNWLPDITLPVTGFRAKLEGDIDNYDLNASADVLSDQASRIMLAGQVSLSQKRLLLSELSTSGDLGKLNARILANITQFDGEDGLNVDTSIAFDKVQLKPLVPEVDSQLNGEILLKASLTPKQLWGSLFCGKVKGKLQGFDISLLCDVNVDKKGLVKISNFALAQGKNRVDAKGQFTLPVALSTDELAALAEGSSRNNWANNTTSTIDLNLDIIDISSLYASAKGSIKGQAKVKGQIDKPIVSGNFEVNKLVFNELRLAKAIVNMDVDINNNWQSTFVINMSDFYQGSLLAKQIELNLEGDLKAHQLTLDLRHPDYSLSQTISGEASVNEQDWRWRGMWEKGIFAAAFDSFVLESPVNIRVSPTSSSIREHCWLSTKMSANPEFSKTGNKTLCLEKLQYSQTLTELSVSIAYNLGIPLLHYAPDIIKSGTTMPLSTNIDLVYSPENGVQLDAYSLMTEAKIVSQKHKIDLVALVANSSLRNQVLKTNLFAGTEQTGAIGLRSSLNLDPENRVHKGQLKIDNVMLSPLQRFIPSVEKLTGLVLGNITFDGLLVEPELNGELFINDVELLVDNYPYPITNFNQKIIIANKTAEIEGELELGAGTADYTGTLTLFNHEQPFDFKGELIGAGMQLAFGKSEVLASPSLKVEVNPSKFTLKGEVTIPNAQIGIEELPASAKSPTSDTIIIGKQPEPPVVPIGLDINVRVLLDPRKLKRVTINALDLKASLGGDVRVQVIQKQDPETKEFSPLETYVYGSINILKGSYEAYGQNLQIQNGAIFFNGAPSLPQFDITAIRNPLNTADNVVAGLRISGNPIIPKVELFSEPSMIQARQLSYLLQGTDLDGGKGTSQDVFLVNALVNFGVGNSENGVNKFGQSLGFDSLNLQTAGQGTNTQVQLTGRISDNIQVTYGVGLFDQASEIGLRYQLLPQLYFEATSGATSAVDLFYEWTRGK